LNIKKLQGRREKKKKKRKITRKLTYDFWGVETSGWGWKYMAGGFKYVAGVKTNGSEVRCVAEEG
jgi:hypothetical protein